ncbi:MAG: serine/threonine protein kinase [Lachnospiraceae bacterium]|nr:serine/threonine protein kinase [Lachnospiraceae bacterium]
MTDATTLSSRALACGMHISDNYIIDHVIGEGGFGITYCCIRVSNNEKVAIKEYFPGALAYRMDDTQVLPYSHQEALFEQGRRHFQTEASILAAFPQLSHIVNIKDILETNGTIYLVMEYIEGITLKQYISDNGPLAFDEFIELLYPVMQDLIQIHSKGLLHRDISPDNLILGTDNQLHLIDFGSASLKSTAASDRKTVILKSGYAPPEQYLPTGKLGAWTDVYGICATIYYTITGFPPTDALERLQGATLPSLMDHAPIRSWQAEVIYHGLQIASADRYQSIDALYQALRIPPLTVTQEHVSQTIRYANMDDKTILPTSIPALPESHSESSRPTMPSIVLVITALLILILYCSLGISGYPVPFWPDRLALTRPATTDTSTSSSMKQATEATTQSTSTETIRSTTSSQATTSDTTTETRNTTTESTTQASTKQKKSSDPNDNFITLPEDDSYESFTD